MKDKTLDLILKLRDMAIRSHYSCEDCFYSCPLSEEGSCNSTEDQPVCSCGADEHNAKVHELFSALTGKKKRPRAVKP